MAPIQHSRRRGHPWVALACACLAASTAFVARAAPGPAAQRLFQNPEQAVSALVAATRAGQTTALSEVLGPDGVPLIQSGDSVADHNARQRFVAAYDRRHRIEYEGTDKAVLIVGAENWPMPIPLVHTASGWRFDTAAGRQEILDRRIGGNELAVIEVCRAYVHAQREYAALFERSGLQRHYAQHFMSREGRRDGLFWPTRTGEPESPLGPLVAEARTGGYTPGRGRSGPHPYYGYYFRILTGQGPDAPGGARSYLSDGRMTGGFALLAYPAKYGDSGIMSFIVNQDGIVFQKDLGPRTAQLAPTITRYDPDASWSPP